MENKKITTQKHSTLDLAYIALFTSILAICSWISVPTSIPFTLQTFGIFLAVGVLGGKRGSLSVLIYILLGTMGVPVFTGFTGGIGVVLGSTGGYIIGFFFSALTMWGMERLFGKNKWVLMLSMVAGLLVCYAFGTIWFILVYANSNGAIGVWTALTWCVFPYIVPDMIKIALALSLCKRLTRFCK